MAEFMGLHVDIFKVFLKNAARVNVTRKAGLIINQGDNPTKKEIQRKQAINKERFGLKINVVNEI